LIAVFAGVIAPSDPLAQNSRWERMVPRRALVRHRQARRDVFSRIVFGARISISIGFVAVGLAITVGTFIGLIAGTPASAPTRC